MLKAGSNVALVDLEAFTQIMRQNYSAVKQLNTRDTLALSQMLLTHNTY